MKLIKYQKGKNLTFTQQQCNELLSFIESVKMNFGLHHSPRYDKKEQRYFVTKAVNWLRQGRDLRFITYFKEGQS